MVQVRAALPSDRSKSSMGLGAKPATLGTHQTRKSPIPVPPIPDLAGKRGGNPRFPTRPELGNRESPFPDSAGNGNRGPDWPQIGKSGIPLCVSTVASRLRVLQDPGCCLVPSRRGDVDPGVSAMVTPKRAPIAEAASGSQRLRVVHGNIEWTQALTGSLEPEANAGADAPAGMVRT